MSLRTTQHAGHTHGIVTKPSHTEGAEALLLLLVRMHCFAGPAQAQGTRRSGVQSHFGAHVTRIQGNG